MLNSTGPARTACPVQKNNFADRKMDVLQQSIRGYARTPLSRDTGRSVSRLGIYRVQLCRYLLADSVHLRKVQYSFRHNWVACIEIQQHRTLLGKITTQHTRDVEQRSAAANHTGLVGTIADHVAVRAKDGISQCNRIQTSSSDVAYTGMIHHRTPYRLRAIVTAPR